MAYERKAEPIGRELVRRLLPRRDPEGHKGTFLSLIHISEPTRP